MRMRWTREDLNALRAFLDACEDAQALSESEYVVDLYDSEPAMTVDLSFEKDGLEILAAEEMAFDDEMDGWYMSAPVADAAQIERALRAAMA